MRYFEADPQRTAIGLAYGPSALDYLAAHPDGIDYLEIPFEQLQHAPALMRIQKNVPLVLHCASLSMASSLRPPPVTVAAIAAVAAQTRTPWIGEHLAFVAADALIENAPPTTVSYTVSPQLSEETVAYVAANLAAARAQLGGVELILENSPQYFHVPGSTMDMADFIGAVAQHCDVDLLLDLTHFLITCRNTGVEPTLALARLPLERVVEVHISGMSSQSGVVWDDHALPAPSCVFDLFEATLARVRPRAVTIEYNWSPDFPQSILVQHIARVRRLLETT